MGNKDSNKDLEFSAEELLELERSRENRSRLAPDGKPRERTHKKGLRVPADVVPRKPGPLENSTPSAVERSQPGERAARGGSITLPPLPPTPPRHPEPEPAAPAPRERSVMDVAGRKPGGRPPSSRTLPMMLPVTGPITTPPANPPAAKAAPLVRSHEAELELPAGEATRGSPPPSSPPAALLWPPPEPSGTGTVEPEEAVTEPQLPQQHGPAELDTQPIPLELLERVSSRLPPPPPESVRAHDPGLSEISEDPAPASNASLDDDLDGDTIEMDGGVVKKAVQMALEAAATAPQVSSALANQDFDLGGPTGPGASLAFEELSAKQRPVLAEDSEGDRANRVAILLSALRPAAGAEERALEAVASAELAFPDQFEEIPSIEQEASPEAAWAATTQPIPPAEPVQPAVPAEEAAPAEAPPARSEAPAGSEMEELDGEELEEVAGEAETGEVPLPPPIPEAPASPFEGIGLEVPATVEVKVAVVEPVEDDGVMTSAPPDIPATAAPPAPPSRDLAATGPLPREREQKDAASRPSPPATPTPREAPAKEVAPRPPEFGETESSGRGQAADKAGVASATRGRKRKRAWFEEIFDEDWLRTLRPRSAEQTRKEIEFLEESLQPSRDSQILDLGCGDGRHALALAARGYQVTGYDLSLPLLIRAADEAQRRELHVNFIHGDFRELSAAEQFDAVYCLFSTFGYFDDDSNRKMIQSVNSALRVGGRFLLDVVNRDYAIRDLPARIWWEGVGCVILEEVDFNYFTSRIISKRSVVFEDGRHLEQEISVRSYSLHELGKILHHAGFRVLEVSGHMAHRTRFFGNCSRSVVLLAEKRGNG